MTIIIQSTIELKVLMKQGRSWVKSLKCFPYLGNKKNIAKSSMFYLRFGGVLHYASAFLV